MCARTRWFDTEDDPMPRAMQPWFRGLPPKVARTEGPAYADRVGEDQCERVTAFVTPLPIELANGKAVIVDDVRRVGSTM